METLTGVMISTVISSWSNSLDFLQDHTTNSIRGFNSLLQLLASFIWPGLSLTSNSLIRPSLGLQSWMQLLLYKLRLLHRSSGHIWTSNAKPTPTSSTRTSDWMELPDRECQLYTYLRLLKVTFTSYSNQKWAAIFHVNTEVLSKCK